MSFYNIFEKHSIKGYRELDLEYASKMNVADSPREFIINSGCKSIFNIIIDELGEYVDNIFFEYSTIASISYEKKLKGFSFIWQTNEHDLFVTKVSRTVGPIWELIQSEKITPYFHPDFFLYPSSPKCFFDLIEPNAVYSEEVFERLNK